MHDGPMVAGPGRKAVCTIPSVWRHPGESERLFSALDSALCRRFLQAALRPEAIEDATFAPTPTPSADLRYDEHRHRRKKVLDELALALIDGTGAGKLGDKPMSEYLTRCAHLELCSN